MLPRETPGLALTSVSREWLGGEKWWVKDGWKRMGMRVWKVARGRVSVQSIEPLLATGEALLDLLKREV
jgi:hypothetical protein